MVHQPSPSRQLIKCSWMLPLNIGSEVIITPMLMMICNAASQNIWRSLAAEMESVYNIYL